jgi:hypothetical protein
MSPRKTVIRGATLVAIALAGLALPAGLLAAGSVVGVTGSTTTNTVTSTTATASTSTAAPITIPTTSSGGLSVLDGLAIGLVALVVFATIIYVIRRDARVHAPRGAAREIDRQRGTVAPRAERVKRSRARAKAARRARRRSGR